MSNTDAKLINVIQLSQNHCTHPIQGRLVYATTENFLGRVVAGYHPDAVHVCLMTPKSALALCQVQSQLNQSGVGLFIFDSYRPLRAVRDFKHWMQAPVADGYELERKKIHYPHIEKNQLAELGYVNDTLSNHCFGDTVDLSLIHLTTHELLDMGACFDYFDEISHATATIEQLGKHVFQNRMLLSNAMQEAGFLPYPKEFWHFTYHEREADGPFDFEITND